MFVRTKISIARQVVNVFISPGGNGSLLLAIDAFFRQLFTESEYALWLRSLIVVDAVGTGLTRYIFGHLLSIALIAQSLRLHSPAQTTDKADLKRETPLSRHVLRTTQQMCSSNGIKTVLGGADVAFFYFVQCQILKLVLSNVLPPYFAEIMAIILLSPTRLAWTKATISDKSQSLWASGFSIGTLNWYCIRRLALPTLIAFLADDFGSFVVTVLAAIANFTRENAAAKYNMSSQAVRSRVVFFEVLLVLFTIFLRFGIAVLLNVALTIVEISMMPPEMTTILQSLKDSNELPQKLFLESGKLTSSEKTDETTSTVSSESQAMTQTSSMGQVTTEISRRTEKTVLPQKERKAISEEAAITTPSSKQSRIPIKGSSKNLTIAEVLQYHQAPLTFRKALKLVRLPLCVWLLELHIKACVLQIVFESIMTLAVRSISAFLSASAQNEMNPYY